MLSRDQNFIRPLSLVFVGLLISQMVDQNTQVLIILRAGSSTFVEEKTTHVKVISYTQAQTLLQSHSNIIHRATSKTTRWYKRLNSCAFKMKITFYCTPLQCKRRKVNICGLLYVFYVYMCVHIGRMIMASSYVSANSR